MPGSRAQVTRVLLGRSAGTLDQATRTAPASAPAILHGTCACHPKELVSTRERVSSQGRRYSEGEPRRRDHGRRPRAIRGRVRQPRDQTNRRPFADGSPVGSKSRSGFIPERWPTRWGHSLERKSVAAAPLSRSVVSPSDGDDDLAARVAVSEVPDRGRHLFERERPVHNRSDGARFEQRPQLLQVLSALL